MTELDQARLAQPDSDRLSDACETDWWGERPREPPPGNRGHAAREDARPIQDREPETRNSDPDSAMPLTQSSLTKLTLADLARKC